MKNNLTRVEYYPKNEKDVRNSILNIHIHDAYMDGYTLIV